MKKRLSLILVIGLLIVSIVPILGQAKDWWLTEAVYTLLDSDIVESTGPQSRIFLPRITAETTDGIAMEMNYSVKKDGKIIADGAYSENTYVDLVGAGTYVFEIKGVDATNSYTFEVKADENLPSLIMETSVCTSVSLSEKLVLPGATIIYKGETVNATINLRMASGAVYRYEEKTVPETGLLTVEYIAEIAGERICYYYQIVVNDDTLGFYDENGNFYPAGTNAYDNMDLSGCVLNDSVSRTFTYSKVLDLSTITKDVPLITLNNAAMNASVHVVPKIRIVDAHDARNYIEIQGRWSADNANMVYSVAGIQGQNLVGFQSGTVYYNGTVFGTETNFPTSTNISRDMPAIYYYDAEEKAVYARWYDQTFMIADFDAGYNAKAWEGFTTGEVYIQVIRNSADDFICVQGVAGKDLSAVEKDTLAPTLSVYGDMEACAVVGYAYPLMQAKAIDVMEGNIPVQLHVYKGCDATSGVEVNVVNGTFVPYETGYYTAVYSATDSYGNTSVKKFNILVKDEDSLEPISADIEGLPQTAYVGAKINLPKPKNVTGGSGSISYEVNLVSASGKKTKITDDYVIMPETGVNTIEYVFTDYLGITSSIGVDITCTKSDVPVLYDVQLPKLLFSGTKLSLPTMEYAPDDSEVNISVKAYLDGKELAITDGVVVPETINKTATLKIVYEAKNSRGIAQKEYEITVFGADINDRTSYFVTTNGTFDIQQKNDGIRFVTEETESSVRFANALLADRFALVLAVDPAQNDCDRITVWLTDSIDSSIQVRLDIVKMDGGNENSKSEFYINGVRGNDMLGNFYSSSAALGISYQKNSASIVDSQKNVLGKIATTESGEYFDGFPSGKVNMEIVCGNVGKKGFAFNVQTINNQVFAGGNAFFNNYPEIVINGNLPLEVSVGDTLIVPSAFGADVLSPNVSITVSIRKGNKTVLDGASVDQAREFTFDSYGTYYVVYKYSDGNTNRSVSYTIKTIESEPPTVVMPELPTTGKVGQQIELLLPEVSDNASTNIEISIIVREPNYNMFYLTEDNLTFTPNRAGTYTVFYYVSDECYNYQMIQHTIVVE